MAGAGARARAEARAQANAKANASARMQILIKYNGDLGATGDDFGIPPQHTNEIHRELKRRRRGL